MSRFNHQVFRRSAAFRLISSLIVALTCGTILEHETIAALATGSVTARVYVCPESVSLAAVKQATQSPLLAACKPFADGASFLRLRPASGGRAAPGQPVAPGVLYWPWLEFGSYVFDGLDARFDLGELLFTTGDGIPVAEEDRATIAIPDAGVEIERRIYLFTSEHANTEALVDLTVEGSGG